LLHVSPQTIRRWTYGPSTRTRFPRPVRVGRRLLFDHFEVQAFLERLKGTVVPA
jgi:predicted DNA-binding transcriptional regulator AlpA